jgi:hypothetical protein
MSGIDSLPGGGKDFSAHRFKRKLKYLSEHSKAVSPLSENQESIIKAVEKYQKFIRRGSFSTAQQRRVINQIKSQEDLGIVKLKKVKKIISNLGQASDVEVEKPKIKRLHEFESPRSKIIKINRDPNLKFKYSPEDYNSANTNRPVASVSQKKELERGVGLAGANKEGSANNRGINDRGLSTPSAKSPGPSIPLSR